MSDDLNLIEAARIGAAITSNPVELPPGHPLCVKSPLAVSTAGVAKVVQDELRRKYNNPEFRLIAHNKVTDPYNPGFASLDEVNKIAQFSYAVDHSECWQRFVAIKEMMHIYTGRFNKSCGTDILASAVKAMENFTLDIHKPLDPEAFCIFLALEVALPRKNRDKLYDLRYKHELPDYPIAVKCKIPLLFAQELFTQSGSPYRGYFSMSKKAYEASL